MSQPYQISKQTVKDLETALNAKQDLLTAGTGIVIENNVISSTSVVEDASETQKGIIRLATSQEAAQGTDTSLAMSPFSVKTIVSESVGKSVQLGFNGTLTGDTLTFVPDQDTYDIKQGYDYEIDLLFPAAGTLPDSTKLVIKNGEETIQILNVKHADANSSVTYGDMKQICRYDNDIGWRWVFNARFSVTDTGIKVFVIPSTVVSLEIDDSAYEKIANKVTTLSSASTDTQYPSAKCVYDMIGNVETALSEV